MEAFTAKVDDIAGSINGIGDFLKDTEKKRKTDKTIGLVAKSAAAAAGGKGVSGGGLLSGFSLKDISDNIAKLSKGLIVYSFAEAKGAPNAFVKFLKDMLDVITSKGKLKSADQITKLYEAVGVSILNMGMGLSKFAWGLIVFAIPAKMKITDLFLKFVEKLFSPKLLDQIKTKKAKQVGIALGIIGTGILKFAGYLALATLAMAVGGPGLLIIIPAIMVVMGVMSLFSKNAKSMKKSSKAIEQMSLGLLFFSGSIMLMSLVKPSDLLMAMGVIMVFGMFVLMLGLIGKIVKGGMSGLKNAGKAVIEMSIGLAAFSLSIMLMKFIDPTDILKAFAVTLVFGLFLLILGESDNVKKGAVAMLIASVSMVVLAFSIMMFSKIEWDTIGKAGAAIGGITLALYVLGSDAKQVLLGSLSLILGGMAVGLLGYALKLWQDQAITWETLGMVGAAIGGLTAVLVILGATGPVVMVGAIALSLVSATLVGSLYLLALGLDRFKKVGWNEDDMASMRLALVGIPSAIMEGFLAAGGPLIFFALPALAASSLALAPVIFAISKYKESGITPADAVSAGDMVKNFIGAVRAPIEEIGKSGGLFSSSDFENGLSAIRGLGSMVSEIAEGVLAASRLEYKSLTGKIVKVTPEDFVKVGDNVTAMINALKAPIMEIGSQSQPLQEEGLLGALGIGMFLPNDNPFRNGMKAVEGVGGLISGIAKGIVDIGSGSITDPANPKGPKLKPLDMAKNVASVVGAMITALADPISQIGKTAKEADGGLFGWVGEQFVGKKVTTLPYDGFAEGMQAVGGLGSLLSGIAGAIKTFGSGKLPDPEHEGKFLDISKDVVPNMKKVFSDILTGLSVPIASFATLDKKQLDLAQERTQQVVKFAQNLNTIVQSASTAVATYQAASGSFALLSVATSNINAAGSALLANNVFSKSTDITNFDRMTGNIVKLADIGPKLKTTADAMKSIGESMVMVFTSLNTVITDKLSAVSTIFEKMVELDKIDAEALKKKIETYKEMVDMAAKMDMSKVNELLSAQGNQGQDMQQTLAAINDALSKLTAAQVQTNAYLKKIASNTKQIGE